MKISDEKKQQYKEILTAHELINRDNIYNEILSELQRLWSLENKVRILFEPYPSKSDYYNNLSLEAKTNDRLNLTKEIMGVLK